MLISLPLRNKVQSINQSISLLINCLFVLIISVCAIVVHICVCIIARTGCIGPNGHNATILEYYSFRI